MKKIYILAGLLLFTIVCFSQQDSARTTNDKPGTPSSLRTPYKPPQRKIHTLNSNVPLNQSIYNGGIESNHIFNEDNRKANPINNGDGKITLQNKPFIRKLPLIKKDCPVINPSDSKPSNVISPVRK